MPEPLTRIETEILDFLIEYLRRNTYQPSIREIGRQFDIKSTKTVSEHLQSLADKGWIERDPSRSRGVRILGIDLGPDSFEVPCHAELAADGSPVSVEGSADGFLIDRRLGGSPENYFLVMKGDSMVDAGIRQGDLLLVTPVAEAELEDGDTVVVSLAGESTVKHYHRRGGEIVLEPANSDYPPILVRDHADAVIAGRVATVIRRMCVAVPARTTSVLEGGSGESIR